MSYLFLMALATMPPEVYVETYDIDTPTYEEVLSEAIHNCKGVDPEKVDIRLLEELLEVEKEFNVPPKLRGMILAAACQESKYNPKARGDKKFSKDRKTPMAVGILQMWKIYEKMYPGLDRTNPVEAARAWMKHIVKQIPKIKRACKHRADAKVWVAAWVTGIRYKKIGGRCRERPKHHRTLKRWHKNIKIKRANGC
tara:strand:- start:1919 stop:2509 length:591 start_codon:yes stop_codon:yes gene_type:complete